MQITGFSTNKTLNLGGQLMALDSPKVMGILNVTPDSFYDGGKYLTARELLLKVNKSLTDGADLLDIGGYSTRPGAEEIPIEEEIRRSVGAIKTVIKHFPEAKISIDTFRSEVARAAVAEGAVMVNDVSGGELDPAMFETVAKLNVPYVLMHMRGNPKTMTKLTDYDDVVRSVIDFMHPRIHRLTQLGQKDIIVDPGFGFAKTREQNFEMLQKLDHFEILGKAMLVGLSRKSMVWKTLDIQPQEALNGSTALHAIALTKGASILRVHDVKECVQVVTLVRELTRYSPSKIEKKEGQ
ncbi:MAG TPA: dihydropteroate synthase [Chryseosolibacter sp.]